MSSDTHRHVLEQRESLQVCEGLLISQRNPEDDVPQLVVSRMYDTDFDQLIEQTSYTGQPCVGSYPSDLYATEPQQPSQNSNLPPLNLGEIDAPFIPTHSQYFDFSGYISPEVEQSFSSPWSTPLSHSSLTPMLMATSLSTTSESFSPFPPTPSLLLNGTASTNDIYDVSPAHMSMQNLSPAFRMPQLTPSPNLTLPYPNSPANIQTPHLQSPSDRSSNARASSAYQSVTHRLQVPHRILQADDGNGSSVEFRVGGVRGVALKEAIQQDGLVGLDGAQDQVFSRDGSRQIHVALMWPGYPQEGMYIKIKDETKNWNITRAQLARDVAHKIYMRFRKLLKQKVASQHARWKISKTTFKNVWLLSLKPGTHNVWVAELEVQLE